MAVLNTGETTVDLNYTAAIDSLESALLAWKLTRESPRASSFNTVKELDDVRSRADLHLWRFHQLP